MHWFRNLKKLRPKGNKTSEKVNDGRPPNSPDVPLEPKQSSRELSNATNDGGQLKSTDVPPGPTEKPKETTSSGEFEDLWAKAEQRLIQDQRMARILKEASQIVEQSGLKIESHGMADHKQLHSFLNTQINELEEQRWIIHFGDHFFGVRDQLTQIFKNILVLKDVINTAASGTPPVAIACAGVTVSLLLYIQAVEQQDKLLDGLEKVSSLIPRLQMTGDLYLKSDSNIPADSMDEFKETLISLFCKVLKFQAHVLCFLRRNSFSQGFRSMLKQDPWTEMTESIRARETEAQNFTRLIDTAQRKSDTEKILQKIEQASRNQLVWQVTSLRDEKAKRFLRMLYTCPYRDRKDRNDNRVPGTCEWFTGHKLFQHWNDSDGSSLLWASADPGCGKSVLSKYLIDEVLPSIRKRTICYFFFRDDFPDQKKSTIAIASIIRQLLMAQPHLLSDSILHKMETDGEKLLESFRGLWGILMDITTSSDSGEIICVMDALDECEEKSRHEFIDAVRDLYSRENKARKVKFLLTSRPYGHIRSELLKRENQIIHLSGENQNEVENISQEINLVISKRVKYISEKKELNPNECEFLQQQLTAVPNRTYLWVSLTMDYIERLPGFTKGEFRRKVQDEMPHTVEDAYSKILNGSPDQARARRLLHIILAAKRPLSMEELSLATALNKEGQSYDDIVNEMESPERFKTTLRDLCGLIVVIVDNRVYLLHQTVKEFLVQYSPRPDNPHCWKHAFAVSESNRILAEICVWYLCADLTETNQLNRFSDYSAAYWPAHFREAGFHRQDRETMLGCNLCVPESELYHAWSYMHGREYAFPKNPTLIAIACFFGLDAVLDQFLDNGNVDTDSQDSDGRTPLFWAARNGYESVVRLLLDTGKVDTDSQDSYGHTPLIWAAGNGHESVVRLLLDTGKVDTDSQDSYGHTPLIWAAGNGHESVVRLLLDTRKVDIDSQDSIGHTPLFWAVRNGHESVVRLLLDTGMVDINPQDSIGQTPLFWAVRNGHESVVRLLLDTGKVDTDSQDSIGHTPLFWAAGNGHESVVRLLIDRGARK